MEAFVKQSGGMRTPVQVHHANFTLRLRRQPRSGVTVHARQLIGTSCRRHYGHDHCCLGGNTRSIRARPIASAAATASGHDHERVRR